MHRGADLNAALGRQAAGQPQHFGAVGLHREIPQRPRVGRLADMHMPAKDGVQRAGEHGLVDRGVRPAPEGPIGLAVGAQQVARDDRRLADPQRQRRLPMPYWTASTHCLNSSRCGPCVALVASGGTAPACLAKAR